MKYCQHCQRKKANRPGRLCWTCYYKEPLARRFIGLSKYSRRGSSAGNPPGQLPAKPTFCLPRTTGKMFVMQQRAERGESLFHPLDATFEHPLKGIAHVDVQPQSR